MMDLDASKPMTVAGVPHSSCDFSSIVLDLVSSDNEERIASAHENGIVILWANDMSSPQILHDTKGEDRVFSLAFSTDSKLLAAAYESGRIRIFDVISGKKIDQYQIKQDYAVEMFFSSTASNDETLNWVESKGRLVHYDLDNHQADGRRIVSDQEIVVADVQKDQDFFVTADSVGKLAAWSLDSGEQLWSGYDRCDDVCLAILPNKTIASSGHDGRLRIWDFDSANPVKKVKAHNNAVVGLAHHAIHGLLSIGREGSIRKWKITKTSKGD